MSKKVDSKDLTPFGNEDIEAEIRGMVKRVLGEPKIPTMGRKLIIEAATPGHFPRLLWEQVGVKNMPPCSIEDQVAAIVACVRAGAAGVHTHPRVPSAPFCWEAPVGAFQDPRLEAEVIDKVYEKVDFVPLGHAWHPRDWVDLAEADFITPTKELLEIGKGNKYIQGNVMPTWMNPRSRRSLLSTWFTLDSFKKGIPYCEENNVKPLIALDIERLTWLKTNLIDTGVFKTPPHFNIQEGKHGVTMSFADPWAHINLISNIETVRKYVPGCTIGLHSGGRNWLPLTVIAILMGIDLVRIGIEDQFWACPHKDVFLKSPVEAVEKVVQIARILGRDIATPDEAREILGIKVTWR